MPHEGSTVVPTDFESPVASDPERDFSEVPDNLWDKVSQAPAFENKSEFNEENIFKQQYFEAAKMYYSDATDVNAQGRAILQLFLRWADVVGQFTRFVLQGDADNPLDARLSWDPEGAGEAYIRPLRTDTFSDDFSASYAQSPSSTGRFNLIPDNTNANGDAETMNAKEQAVIIFGWMERLADNEVPYEYLQAEINDNVGVRREEFLLYQMEGVDTLKVAERHRGPLMVPPGFDIDIDLDIKTTNIRTGLWPIGVEIVRADNVNFGGVVG